jgi:hypothetical protein
MSQVAQSAGLSTSDLIQLAILVVMVAGGVGGLVAWIVALILGRRADAKREAELRQEQAHTRVGLGLDQGRNEAIAGLELAVKQANEKA